MTPARSQKPRVLHVQKVAGIAGSETHLLRLLPALATAGYEPAMMVLASRTDHPADFVDRMRATGVSTVVIPLRGDADPLAWGTIVRRVRRLRYDIVHTHLVHGDFYGVSAARVAGVRRVVSTRHNDNAFRRHAAMRQAVRALMRGCSRVVCISEHLGRFVRDVEGVSADRIRIVRYGLDVSARPPRGDWRASVGVPDGAPLLGMVARLVQQKGHRTLLDAFAMMTVRFPAVRLVIVGDGPLRLTLESQAVALGIGERVRFLGHLPNAARLMPEFDVFVHPSRWEGFGLVFLEAMAAGLPVVATRVSAIPEIVDHGRSGLLVPVDDAPALAGALSTLLADPWLACSMGRAGRQRVLQEFDAEVMVDKTSRLYAEILAGESRVRAA